MLESRGGYYPIPPVKSKWNNFVNVNSRDRITVFHKSGNSKFVIIKNWWNSDGEEDDLRSKEDWISDKYGSLTILDSNLPNWWCKNDSRLKVEVSCDCGNVSTKRWINISSGSTKSCGRCLSNTKEYWFSRKYHKLSIIPELDSSHNLNLRLPGSFSPSWRSKSARIEVKCDCGKITATRIYELLTLRTISCGCALNDARSGESRKFYESVRGIFPEAEYSKKGIIPNREFDIWVPSHNLAIEYHGLHWHSEARRSDKEKLKDHEKFLECRKLGIRLIQIYSDDWRDRRGIFLDLLKKINGKKQKRIYNLVPRRIERLDAIHFLLQNHYLGHRGISGSLYCGLFGSNQELYSASVFKKRKEGEYEWSRYCFKLGYRSWNPAQKTLNWVVKLLPVVKKIITFSDNTLHTGEMYAKLGFVKIAEVPPDYSYTNGTTKRHKFSFRVKAGTNEKMEAAQSNFYRIWDSGKTKWELTI